MSIAWKKLLVAGAGLLGSALMAGSPVARVPVLLELFTSEGCSSCPPADRLLEKFDREQSIPGADLIVLSEHVDYWNQLGWADPFSSSLYSQRQREYAGRLRGDVYTPELVVDGARGLVGSDEREAADAIKDAIRTPKAPIGLHAELADRKATVSIHLDQPLDGVLYLAFAHDATKSQVLRGENRGRGLTHVAVVYSIRKVAQLDRRTAFDQSFTVDLQPGMTGEKTRIVAFVEKGDAGRVTAIGQTRL